MLPGDSEMKDGLQVHEVGEDTDYGCGGCYHDDEPEVELRFGPDIFPLPLQDADEDFVGHCVERPGACGWEEGWMVVVRDGVFSERFLH